MTERPLRFGPLLAASRPGRPASGRDGLPLLGCAWNSDTHIVSGSRRREVSALRMRSAAGSLGAIFMCSSVFMQCAAAADKPATERPVDKKPAATRGIREPPQPTKGPGSSDYPCGRVDKSLKGEGENGYWLFEPSHPVPKEAPVILFLHGTRAANPYDYGGWIEHIVRRCNIVIYPIFEPKSPWREKREGNEIELRRALQATRTAIDYLKRSGHIKPRLDEFAITGHSFGGGLTGQVAALAQESGLPVPKAVMPVEPGWKGREKMPFDILAKVPASALVLIVEGDQDQFADSRKGPEMLEAMTGVPANHKAFVRLISDSHGDKPLISDHAAPLAPDPTYGAPLTPKNLRRRRLAAALTGMREGETDALDYLGYWKLFDELCTTGFSGGTIDQVVGTGSTLEIGKWSDGREIAPAKVMRKP